jgi:hypothetical protein
MLFPSSEEGSRSVDDTTTTVVGIMGDDPLVSRILGMLLEGAGYEARPLDEIEEDTPEGFEKRKQLVGLLVGSISLGKSQESGRAEVQITYRFGPPLVSDAESDDSFMPGLKNGRASITPDTNAPTLTVVVVR